MTYDYYFFSYTLKVVNMKFNLFMGHHRGAIRNLATIVYVYHK